MRRVAVLGMLLMAGLMTTIATALAQPQPRKPKAPSLTEPDPFAGVGAFRLTAPPKIEAVFGDAAAFKKTVDRFHVVHAEMTRARDDFAKNVQATLLTLEADRGGARRCPADAVALTYTRAFRQGQLYKTLGTELESLFAQIKALDGLGETTGLTPDYRWKVTRALKLYARVLVDYREMKVAFQSQLAADLAVHLCDTATLLAKGDEREKAGAPPTGEVAAARFDPVQPRRPPKEVPGPPIAASVATFFVDNSSCQTSVRVVVDGTLLGEVGSTSKAAFRSLVGRHDLCVIPSTSKAACGDPGTLRKTFIHDGWQIAMRCDR